MALGTGSKLGPYEIVESIGAGGMGVVYKARDSRLGRLVAIKVVSEKGDGKEFQRRLRKEAKAASALTHPNIVALYDVLDFENGEAIVMEFVQGRSLRHAFERKSLSQNEIIEITAQVASALGDAHKAGIVHRDIKPENIILTTNHQAKVLDFGIAKVLQEPHLHAETADTQTVEHATVAGLIVGTLFYMSPEQAQGRTVDWRTDIFSLGVLLYEGLAGKRPFGGNNTIEVIHSIHYDTPSPLPNISPALQDILDKALAKDPEERYQSASDFALDLRRLKRTKVVSPAAVRPKKSFRKVAVWFTIPIVLLLSYIGFRVLARPAKSAIRPGKLTPVTTDEGYEGEPCFLPDGETISYVSDRTGNFDIYLRQVSGGPDVNLTNHPSDDVQPSVSPDGRWIAFVSTRQSQKGLIYQNPNASPTGGDIWIMPALGGAPRRIVENGNFPSWSKDGTHLIYTAGPWLRQAIFKISSSGGKPEKIPIDFSQIEPAPLFLHRPSYSPNGKWIILEGNANAILVAPSSGGNARKVSAGRSPSWNRDGTAIVVSSAERGANYSLRQIAFDPNDGTFSGATPLTIGRGADFQPAVSIATGSIAFSATDITFNIERIPFGSDTKNPEARPEQLTFGNNVNWFFHSSPDGKELVYQSLRGSSFHIWKMTADRQAVQLTSDSSFMDQQPKWSPDGRLIAFVRRKVESDDQTQSIYVMSADGANPNLILNGAGGFLNWMPDSREILFFDKNQIRGVDIHTKKTRTIVREVRNVYNVSGDGRWLICGYIGPNGTTDLRAVQVSGGPSIPVVDTIHEEGHPFFSVDSKWVYFQYDHKNVFRVPRPAQQWRRDPPQQVTSFPESGLYLEDVQPTLDGKFLLYARGRFRSDIWLLSQ